MACNPNLSSASFKHLNVCKGLDLHGSGLTNVNSINGIVTSSLISSNTNPSVSLSPPVTLLTTQSGSIFRINGNGVVTLPAPTNGVKYTFVVNGHITDFNTYIITCPSQVLYGSLLSSDGTPVINGAIRTVSTAISLNANAVIGDKYVFYSDGTYWYVNGTTANFNSTQPLPIYPEPLPPMSP